MLCLQAWVQASFVRRDHKRHASLFSKIGGNKVGHVFFELKDCVLGDASCLLRDLQRQAASILPHEFRDPEDVLLFVGQESLTPPDFAYRKALTLDEAQRALCMLSNAEQVDMMWDDNDAWATTKLNSLPPGLTYETKNTKLELAYGLDEQHEFPLEIANGQHKHKITQVWCMSLEAQVKDLSFLKRLGRAAKLLFLSQVAPKDWACCANIAVMQCMLGHIPEGISQLSKLRNLYCTSVTSFPSDFPKLRLNDLHFMTCNELDLQLATNMTSLKKLTIWNCNTFCTLNKLGDLLNLEELVLRDNNFFGSIPTELGKLVHLKKLVLTNNNFVGSIPSELSRLTRISHLEIHEDNIQAFDATWPPEVLALQVFNK